MFTSNKVVPFALHGSSFDHQAIYISAATFNNNSTAAAATTTSSSSLALLLLHRVPDKKAQLFFSR